MWNNSNIKEESGFFLVKPVRKKKQKKKKKQNKKKKKNKKKMQPKKNEHETMNFS